MHPVLLTHAVRVCTAPADWPCLHGTCSTLASKKHPRGWQAGPSVCVSHCLTGRNLVGGGGEQPCSEDMAGWPSSFPAFLPNLFPPPVPGCSSPPPPNSTHFLSIEVEGASVQPMVLVLEGSQGREFYSGCERSNCINARQKAWGWPVSATSDLSDSCAEGRGQE